MRPIRQLLYHLQAKFSGMCSRRIISLTVLATALLVFLTFLFYQAPLISDDFLFGDLRFPGILSVVDYVLHYGNGRILGNLAAVLFVQNKFLCALFRAILVELLIVCIAKFFGKKLELSVVSAVFLLFLGVSPEIFGQVFTWTSGFMNYVPPVVIMLVCLLILKNEKNCKLTWRIVLFLLGTMSQLYAEHNTLINLLISGMTWLLLLKKRDAFQKRASGAWFIGCVLGAIIMFGVPLIMEATTGPLSGYRKIALSFVEVFANAKDCVLSALVYYAHSSCLWCVASIAAFIMIRKPMTLLQHLRLCFYCCYPAISLICNVTYTPIHSIWSIRFIALCGGLIIYLCCFLFDTFRFVSERNIKCKLINYLFLCIFALVPFFVVRPFAARCIFLSYVFACIFVLHVFVYTREHVWTKSPFHIFIPKWMALVLSILLLFEFAHVGKLDRLRTKYIEQAMQQNQTTITLFEFPSRYTYTTWLIHKFYYYEVPNDIEFIIVEYGQWLNS